MRSPDTNVLARWLLGDDLVQANMARAILAERTWISLTVMLELGWVLSKSIGLARGIVADMLRQVADLETTVVENSDLVDWAIARYRGGADWGDVLHLVAGSANADSFVTFDQSLPRKAGTDSPLSVELLRF